MKNQWRLIVGLVLVLLVVIFALLNGAVVPINFGFVTVHWPMILILVVALLIGVVVALLTTMGNSSDRKDDSQTKATVKQLNEKVTTLTTQNEQLQQLIDERDQTIEQLSKNSQTESESTNNA